MLDETLISLEMTAPEQLVPAREAPEPLELRAAAGEAASTARATWARIGAPHGWTRRSAWSEARWRQELSRADICAWLAVVEEEVAGLLELEVGPDGNVGIRLLGLVPEFVGRGFGGALLTRATRLAWSMTTANGEPTRRVWVQTSSLDHAHARRNYEARGFHVFRIERGSAS